MRASASRREEVDKRVGRGGGDCLPCRPSLQMSLNVNFPTLHSICIKRWQANLSTRKFIFYFNYAVTSNINIVWHPKGWATGRASYPSRHLTTPPPSFTRHCSIPKLHLCASHKINRQNCFRGNIFKLLMGLIDWVYITWDIQLLNKSYDAICVF